MAKFSSRLSFRQTAERQTINILKQISKGHIGTNRNYFDSIVKLAEYAQEHLSCSLKNLTQDQIAQYLNERCKTLSRSSVQKDLLAFQAMLRHAKVADPLPIDKLLLPGTKSELEDKKNSRFYTKKQIQIICQHQSQKFSLSTQIASSSGLRAHELLTLQRIDERGADKRDKYKEAQELKFTGLNGSKYTVKGKGGLIREVIIPKHLSIQLEEYRLNQDKLIIDRGIYYHSRYDIPGGQRWSNSFTKASLRSLGWTTGAHGVRHSYAQERMKELQKKIDYKTSLAIVSQELGHFRPDITLVYLR
ncbi:site-specific integrase [Photobacterium damselae]|uniref:site-specific integrase n=1 Tax=Photobacterium damselae TaxID=38293 RepID=UPI0040682E39